jgi:hypothetical protein
MSGQCDKCKEIIKMAYNYIRPEPLRSYYIKRIPRWISVKDEYPGDGETVLFRYKDKHGEMYLTGWYHSEIKSWTCNAVGFFTNSFEKAHEDCELRRKNVTHWMHLPFTPEHQECEDVGRV